VVVIQITDTEVYYEVIIPPCGYDLNT